MAENNLITRSDLARVREVDFTLMFTESIKKLVEALGVTRKIAKQAGTVLKTYKATGTLEDGNVAEGETIPLSKYKTEPVTYKEITLKKWRKATSAEAIIDRGYDQAVTMTTDRMLKDVQKASAPTSSPSSALAPALLPARDCRPLWLSLGASCRFCLRMTPFPPSTS